MIDLLVKVRTRDAGEIIGVLVDTHLMPINRGPQVGLDVKQRLVQGPEQVQLVLFALVAHPRGFTFGPISDVMPLFSEGFLSYLQSDEVYTCPTCEQEHPAGEVCEEHVQ